MEEEVAKRVAGEAGRRIQQRIAERLVEEAARTQGQEQVDCPKCGGKLRYRGQKSRWIATTSGEVKVERGCVYCEGCLKGILPPG